MSSNTDIVNIKTIGDPSLQSHKIYFLNLKKNLSDIRKELKKRNIINDTLLFQNKISSDNDDEFYEIGREIEEELLLEHITDIIVNDDNSKNIFLYLKKNSSSDWDTLNDK